MSLATRPKTRGHLVGGAGLDEVEREVGAQCGRCVQDDTLGVGVQKPDAGNWRSLTCA